jgi:HK97 family phage major capsid protein
MNLKALNEKRVELMGKMEDMVKNIELEARSFGDDEEKEFEAAKKEIEKIDNTINKMEEFRNMNISKKEAVTDVVIGRKEAEVKAFIDYLKNPVKNANFDVGSNGVLIPVTIEKQIIEKIQEICPIYNLARVFDVKGELRVPYYGDNSGDNITCTYAEEFTELTAHAGKFTAVTLTGYTAGVLTLISKSLIGKAQEAGINIVNFIVGEIAKKVAFFIEKEFLKGTGSSACQGILTGATNVIETTTASAIKSDDLISLQDSIPDIYQRDAVWIMNRSTKSAIRRLKDGNGNYLLNPDLTAQWGYSLLGKPVYTSDNMPLLEDGEKAVIYGDLTGLTAKFAQNIEMQILNEHYATQHALGICGWLEVDSKVTNQQKLAVLEVKTAS